MKINYIESVLPLALLLLTSVLVVVVGSWQDPQRNVRRLDNHQSLPNKRALHPIYNWNWNDNLNHISDHHQENDDSLVNIFTTKSDSNQRIDQLTYDQQRTVYLFRTETKRFYFPLYRSKTNASLTITPCESSIHLQLFYISARTVKRLRKRKVNRRSKRPSIKLVAQQLWNDPRRQLIANHTGSQRFQQTLSRHGLYIIQMVSEYSTDLSTKLFLSSYGDPYPIVPPVASVLSKQIYSNGYWNSGINQDDEDDDLDSGRMNNSNLFSVELWWNPALSNSQQQQQQQQQEANPYQYCVAVSEARHHRDNCLINQVPIDSYSQSDSELNEINHILATLSQLQVDSTQQESGDWWERAAKRLLRDSLYKEFTKNVRHWECTNRTSMIVRKLKPDLTYYVDVYVSDPSRNTSSRYWTSNFTLSVPPKLRPSPTSSKSKPNLPPKQILHDSLFTGVFLDAKNKYRKRLLYRVTGGNGDHHRHHNRRLHIFIQLCTGFGPIQLTIRQTFGAEIYFDRRKRHNNYQNNRNNDLIFGGSHDEESNDQGVLYLEDISETRTIEVTIPVGDSNGTTYLEFELSSANLRQSRSVVLLASNELSRFPFPRMPNDRTIRAMETISNCNSITLAWNASPDERVLYCILQRNADLKYSSFEESRELCDRIRPINPNKRALADNNNNGEEDKDDDDDGDDDGDGQIDYEEVKFKDPTRKVICRRYKSSKRRMNNLIMQNVRRLSPGKRYVFQVEVRKSGGRSLNYEQVWAETKEQDRCSSKRFGH